MLVALDDSCSESFALSNIAPLRRPYSRFYFIIPVQRFMILNEAPTEPLSVADGVAISKEELGHFDVTVANILAAPLIKLEPILAYFTRPGTLSASN